jgi:hypothetical protein
MTVEARVLFVILFFTAWAFCGLIAWAALAVLKRGRGAAYALPASIAAACVFGVAIPLAGFDDQAGLLISVLAAVAGSLLAYAVVLLLYRRYVPGASAPAGPVERPPRE